MAGVSKNESLFLVIGSRRGVFRFISRFLRNVLYCFIFVFFIWRILDIFYWFVIILVSRTVSFVFFLLNGLLRFLKNCISDLIFLWNVVWKFFSVSWWNLDFGFVFGVAYVSNSFISGVILGLDSIYLWRVLGFFVRFIALFFFLIIVLFCLWVWSMTIVENLVFVLAIVNK